MVAWVVLWGDGAVPLRQNNGQETEKCLRKVEKLVATKVVICYNGTDYIDIMGINAL